jgi:transcriptional regulator with XRE-family HTH domain
MGCFPRARAAAKGDAMREATFRKRFGRAVKARRHEVGYTQRELAERAGIAEKYLSRIEMGLATPSVLVAHQLAVALGASLDTLIDRPAEDMPPGLAPVVRLLRGRATTEIGRAHRILIELFR